MGPVGPVGPQGAQGLPGPTLPAHPVVLLTSSAKLDRHRQVTLVVNCPPAAGACEITYALWTKLSRHSVRIARGHAILTAGNDNLRITIARSSALDAALRRGLSTELHVYSRENEGQLSYVAPALKLS
jgi:hypothetical protein